MPTTIEKWPLTGASSDLDEYLHGLKAMYVEGVEDPTEVMLSRVAAIRDVWELVEIIDELRARLAAAESERDRATFWRESYELVRDTVIETYLSVFPDADIDSLDDDSAEESIIVNALKQIQDRHDRYRAALEWYADEDNYDGYAPGAWLDATEWGYDCGYRARRALEGVK